MIVGVKATQIGPGGGLTHLVQLVHWFGELAPQVRFIVYGHRGQADLFPPPPGNVKYRLYGLPSYGLAGRLFWEMTQFPKILAHDRCDILLELGNYATPNPPCPSVTLIHNLAPFVPDYVQTESLYQRLRLNLLKRLTLSAVQHAAGTIFLSDFARQMISSQVKSAAKPIAVIYHGASERQGRPVEIEDQKSKVAREQILCVSHVYRYKGILDLIKGYALALTMDPSLPDLVIAGALYDTTYLNQIHRFVEAAQIQSRVRFLGAVSESELDRLYSSCRFFVFPSTIENCPNILLEALAAGCAIACSNVGVMPEICGDAAVYFDPAQPEAIAAQILELHQNKQLRGQLSERAATRSADFSWRRTAEQTLDFLIAICSSSRSRDTLNVGVEVGKDRLGGATRV